LVLGDNLGLNEILGFVKSFTANHPCRVCKISREKLIIDERPDSSMRRNESNYNEDVLLNNPKLTGVKERCVFDQIPSFNVYDDISVDIMHDLFEGICHYDISLVLGHFIENNFFTLEILNNRKTYFSYGYSAAGNVSVPITQEHIENKKFQMSASEMACFCKFLPLMIGK
jgi:hypothetical protein